MTNTEKVDAIIGNIYAMMERPGSQALTPKEMKERADRLRGYASMIKMQGGKVNKSYE